MELGLSFSCSLSCCHAACSGPGQTSSAGAGETAGAGATVVVSGTPVLSAAAEAAAHADLPAASAVEGLSGSGRVGLACQQSKRSLAVLSFGDWTEVVRLGLILQIKIL